MASSTSARILIDVSFAMVLARPVLAGAPPGPPPTAVEPGARFLLSADVAAGVLAGRGSPVPASASLRVSPMLALAEERVRVGATAAVLVDNPGRWAAAGPRVSLELHRLGSGRDLARWNLGGEALFGAGATRLLGGFTSLELPEVLAVTAYVGRETRRHDWRLELAIGAVRHPRRHAARRMPPRLSPLATVYDAVWVASRTKLMAASVSDARVAPRLSPLLERWARRPPADGAALARALDEAHLEVLGSGDLGVADVRRSAVASFPGQPVDERAFVLTVLQAWRDALEEGRAR